MWLKDADVTCVNADTSRGPYLVNMRFDDYCLCLPVVPELGGEAVRIQLRLGVYVEPRKVIDLIRQRETDGDVASTRILEVAIDDAVEFRSQFREFIGPEGTSVGQH
jgi:hypothetical protein